MNVKGGVTDLFAPFPGKVIKIMTPAKRSLDLLGTFYRWKRNLIEVPH
jgi:hypothetical protein